MSRKDRLKNKARKAKAAQNNIVLDVTQDKNDNWKILPPTVVNAAKKDEITLAEFPRELHNGFPWASWGFNDKRPTEVRQKLGKLAMSGRVMHDIAKRLYGKGLVWYDRDELRNHGSKAEPCTSNAIEDFMEDNLIETEWFFPQCLDHVYHYNSFSEAILNDNGDYIATLAHKEAEFSRLALQNTSNLCIETLYYTPDFAINHNIAHDRVKEIPLMPWFARERFLDNLKGKKFAWHSRIKTPGMIYYATQPWLGLLRENGWADVSISVPEVVNAMMDNQIVLKYQISIPETYFEVRYIEWHSYDDEMRTKKINELIGKIESTLKGTKNAFKSITTLFKQDPNTGAAMGKIEIIAIDDKIKKDSWVPSADKSDSKIVQGLGGHSSLIGLAPEGGSMGAGSGSDKREVYNIEIDTNTVEQQTLLQILNIIARFNAKKYPKDWNKVCRVAHTEHTTKDVNATGRIEEKPTK